MHATSHRELDVWKLSMELARDIYSVARNIPKQEEYRLTGQMIRAAISIAANIAEGHARATRKEYAHFISISKGSASEPETLVLLARDTELLTSDQTSPVLEKIERVARMLTRLYLRLREPPNP